MKTATVFGVLAVALLFGGSPAFAHERYHDHDDDYRAVKKVIRVLDEAVNDGHGRRHCSRSYHHHKPRFCHRHGRHYRNVCKTRHHPRSTTVIFDI